MRTFHFQFLHFEAKFFECLGMVAYSRFAKGITKMKVSLVALAVVVAAIALTFAVGCGVLGNPSPCDRSQAMRDALEMATGRDCDLITDDDLADVRYLDLSFSDNGLKKSDFSGLYNVISVDFVGGSSSYGWHRLPDSWARSNQPSPIMGASPSVIVVALNSLPTVSHLMFAKIATDSGSYHVTDTVIQHYYDSTCFGPDLTKATLEWFEELENLGEVTLCAVEELPSNVSDELKGRGVTIDAISACVALNQDSELASRISYCRESRAPKDGCSASVNDRSCSFRY